MRRILLLFIVSSMFLSVDSFSQQSFTSVSNSYSQNFDGMGTSATATLPTNWKVDINNSTPRFIGTYALALNATAQVGGANLASNASYGIYNFGSGITTVGGTDRALGGLSSGSGGNSVNSYFYIKNNDAAAIASFTISYDVEKYRNGSNAAGFTIQMYYSANGSTWTSAGNNFLSSFAADMNSSGYTTAPGNSISVSNQNLTISVSPGSVFYFAFNYSVTSGSTVTSAQALGIDNFAVTANYCSPSKLIFSTQPSASISQGTFIPLTVSIACASNTLITSCNSGNITLSFSGCGLMGTVTKPVVNGAASFSDIYIDRSVQNSVKFTAAYSGSCGTYTDAISNSFNVAAPLGAPSITTIISENFDAVNWARATGPVTITNTSSAGGSDVTGVKTIAGNNVMSKSYSKNNPSGEQGSTNTITFSNITGLAIYAAVTFSFQIGSLGTGTGAGTDNNEFLKIETSLDGGTTWNTVLTNSGIGDHLFPLSSSSPYNIQYNANQLYASGSSLWNQSAFDINLPAGTSQFMFRMVANNNRSNENWVIDNLSLQGTTYGLNAPKLLPTATGYSLNACPGAANTISGAVDNTLGAVTYSWSPNFNISNPNISNPVVTPTTSTTYTVTITDAELCTATASIIVNIPSGAAGMWTGTASNDWFNCSNWANGVVPDLSTDVTVPNTASNIASVDITSPYAATFSNIAKSKNLTITNQKVSFASTSENLIAAGNVTIQSDASLDMTNGGTIEVQGDWNNQVSTAGKGFLSGLGKVVFSGIINQWITSVNATENFYNFEINKSLNTLNLTGNITVSKNLVLAKGIITTGNNLFTWSNSGVLTSPTGVNYKDSYICLCDATGTSPISFTKPFDGLKGFRIKNVTSSDTYFPVGVDFVSPNRMMINNQGDVDDLTVAMEKGDIGVTNGKVVERIWYVKQSHPSTKTMQCDMRLYFTKRDYVGNPSQDEVENNYNYGFNYFIQKDYSDPNYVNVARNVDVMDFVGAIPTAFDKEIYGQYTIASGTKDTLGRTGIVSFSRFSVMNPTNFILPVHIINFKAFEKGAANELNWESLAETGLLNYEIERSFDGIHYTVIGSVNALNNGLDTKYAFTDLHPADGNNFYRLKYTEKAGTKRYTYILNVKRGSGAVSISIYPNPVTNHKIIVQLNHVPNGRYQLQLFNVLGQQLMFKQIVHEQGSATETISLPANILRGTYFVQLNTGNDRYVTKLEVQ